MITSREDLEKEHQQEIIWLQFWDELYNINYKYIRYAESLKDRTRKGVFYIKDQNEQIKYYMSVLVCPPEWGEPYDLWVMDPKEYKTKYITNKLNVLINYAKENDYLMEIDVINDKKELSGTFKIEENTANYSKDNKMAFMITKGNATTYSAREKLARTQIISSLVGL